MVATHRRRSCLSACYAAGLLLLPTLAGLTEAGEPAQSAAATSAERQAAPLGPIGVAVSPDGKSLYVVHADAEQIAVVDADRGKVSRSIAMPAEPTGLVLSPDGATLYVTCAAPEGTVAVVDVKSGKVDRSIPVGHWPIGPAISPDGKTLYVPNRFDNNVAVVDLEAGRIMSVPTTTREPYAAAVTPDGKSVFVINHLPLGRADADVAAVVTAIDTATNKRQTIRLPNGTSGMRGICVAPDGKHVYVTHILSRYQMPTTQVERGWMNTNALSIIDARKGKRINTVLLDDVDRGAANPWGVASTPDGKTLCVAHAGTHELSIIDAGALIEKLLALPEKKDPSRPHAEIAADVPNDLAFLRGLRRRVPLSGDGPKVNGPRGIAVAGSKAFVAAYFTDNLAGVDLESEQESVVDTIALGPERRMSVRRRGEMLFNDATLCFQHWQSCASCHPDARADALNWDLTSDGLGNPKNALSLLMAHETPPSMASGILSTAEAAVRSKLKHQLFAACADEDAAAIDAYLKSLTPVPSPYLVGGKLSRAARRGRKLFFDAKINCAKCHPKPLFTDMLMHDVGSRGRYDRRDTFDTPTLIECWRTAPYMHDGRYLTVKELLTKGKHSNDDGQLDKLSRRQVKDLVKYVLSLESQEVRARKAEDVPHHCEPLTPGVNRLDDRGFALLHRAASGGHVARVTELIESGADVNVRQAKYHGTPLQYAATWGHSEVVRVLLDHNAKIDATDTAGRTPLMWAAVEGKTKTVRLLLDRDANVNAKTRHAWTALHYAVDRRRAETAQLLIDRGADFAARNSLGKTPRDLSGDQKLRWPEPAKSRKIIPDAKMPAEPSDKTAESRAPGAERGQGREGPDTRTSRQGDPPVPRALRDTGRLPDYVSTVLRWLPLDTETLIVAKDFDFPDARPRAHKNLGPARTGRVMAVWPLPGPTKGALSGRQVRWAIHGGRNYKVVSSFGTLRREDASVIRFEEQWPEEELQDLRKQLRGAAKNVRSLSGHDVYVFPPDPGKVRGGAKPWQGQYVVLLNPVTIITASSDAYLGQLLARMEAKPRDSALPSELPEWKYVDATADVWLLRDLPKQNDQIRRLLPDARRKLSGLVWTAYAGDSKPFRAVYLPLPGKNVEDIARAPWIKPPEKEIPKELATLLDFTTAPDGVVTMTFPREARTPSEIEQLRHHAKQFQESDAKTHLFVYFVFYLGSSQGILR